MGMLGCVVLLLLSALASDVAFAKKNATLRFWLQALSPLSGVLGLGAAANGLVCIIKMLGYLGFIGHAPMVYLGNLAAGVCSLLLGIRYGYAAALLWLGGKLSKTTRARLDSLHALLGKNEKTLGRAGLALGTFCILLNLVF